ncbi:hypothetical protein P7C71_g4938, partial [Lecanoromycetidae sp. Uapishka_2]
MSMEKVPRLSRMSREQLADILLSENAHTVAVVDVRTHDHVGGHIQTSIHVPSTDLDHRIPELVRKLSTMEKVVFHCALSQERGPRAARRYLEERDRKVKNKDMMGQAGPPDIGIVDGEGQKKLSEAKDQEVYVLDKGFVGWQEKYGHDLRLTEAYAPDIWSDYC